MAATDAWQIDMWTTDPVVRIRNIPAARSKSWISCLLRPIDNCSGIRNGWWFASIIRRLFNDVFQSFLVRGLTLFEGKPSVPTIPNDIVAVLVADDRDRAEMVGVEVAWIGGMRFSIPPCALVAQSVAQN
jgi:hypothetical protein